MAPHLLKHVFNIFYMLRNELVCTWPWNDDIFYLHVRCVTKNNVTKWHYHYGLVDLCLLKYISNLVSEML